MLLSRTLKAFGRDLKKIETHDTEINKHLFLWGKKQTCFLLPPERQAGERQMGAKLLLREKPAEGGGAARRQVGHTCAQQGPGASQAF